MVEYKMRNKGSKTNKNCWKLEVINQNNIIFEGEYKTLQEIAMECGKSYNQVVEMSSNRKKQPSGRFDTTYKLLKMVGKLNKDEEEVSVEDEVADTPDTDGEISNPLS